MFADQSQLRHTCSRKLLTPRLDFLQDDENGWSDFSFAAALDNGEALETMIAIILKDNNNYNQQLGSALIAAIGCRALGSVSLLMAALGKDGPSNDQNWPSSVVAHMVAQ